MTDEQRVECAERICGKADDEIAKIVTRGITTAGDSGDLGVFIMVASVIFDKLHEQAARLEAALLDIGIEAAVIDSKVRERRGEVVEYRAAARVAALRKG